MIDTDTWTKTIRCLRGQHDRKQVYTRIVRL